MADVLIDLTELNEVKSQLDAIISEFDDATSNSEELEADIGNPFGQSKLRDEAREFEERWDDKRDELKEGLKTVLEQVTAVVDSFEKLDTETAIALEQPEQAPTQPARGPGPTV